MRDADCSILVAKVEPLAATSSVSEPRVEDAGSSEDELEVENGREP